METRLAHVDHNKYDPPTSLITYTTIVLDHEMECLVTHTKLNNTILVYMILNG